MLVEELLKVIWKRFQKTTHGLLQKRSESILKNWLYLEVDSEDAQEFEETLALAKELENEFGKTVSEEGLSKNQIEEIGK